MKKFEVTTSYTLEVIAKDEEKAKEKFLEEMDSVDVSWIEDCVEVKEI